MIIIAKINETAATTEDFKTSDSKDTNLSRHSDSCVKIRMINGATSITNKNALRPDPKAASTIKKSNRLHHFKIKVF